MREAGRRTGGPALRDGLVGDEDLTKLGVLDCPANCTAENIIGRKPLIVAGMFVQARALVVLALSNGAIPVAAGAAALLGLGTALAAMRNI